MSERRLDQIDAVATGLSRAVVRAVRADGLVEVELPAPQGGRLLCEALRQGGDLAAGLAAGDEVLVFRQPSCAADGVILGSIAGQPASPGAAPQTSSEPLTQQQPPVLRTLSAAQIVIEAGEELELRCGKGTIKIQRDGKIIIRGEHILSAAKGTHRIKGGSVAIN